MPISLDNDGLMSSFVCLGFREKYARRGMGQLSPFAVHQVTKLIKDGLAIDNISTKYGISMGHAMLRMFLIVVDRGDLYHNAMSCQSFDTI